MSERLETLKKARLAWSRTGTRMRRCWPLLFDRDKAERARTSSSRFTMLVDVLDRAIGGEEVISPRG